MPAAPSAPPAAAAVLTLDAIPAAQIRKGIKRGAVGASVAIIQHVVGTTRDGIFGPATRAAVVAFQRSHGLVADGIVGPLTWAAIVEVANGGTGVHPVSVSSVSVALINRGITSGARGQTVATIQRAVGATPDGIFGPAHHGVGQGVPAGARLVRGRHRRPPDVARDRGGHRPLTEAPPAPLGATCRTGRSPELRPGPPLEDDAPALAGPSLADDERRVVDVAPQLDLRVPARHVDVARDPSTSHVGAPANAGCARRRRSATSRSRTTGRRSSSAISASSYRCRLTSRPTPVSRRSSRSFDPASRPT